MKTESPSALRAPPPAGEGILRASGHRALSIVFLVMLLALLAACAETAPPVLAPQPGPDDAAGPSANLPYRPVMAGTAYFGVGAAP